MAQVTATELAGVTKIMDLEATCYAKFCHYAEIASDKAVRLLCDQLADRSREHYQAVMAQIGADSGQSH